ncbi:hypothetical protein BJF78_08605 [Pseudonocardia sp. CNS-139]|nr:hypothetical protein BJF78_08605 [Pseudonocardia sp. CNS-139]
MRQFVQREGLSSDLLLPTSLQLRKEVQGLPETVHDLPTEADVRAAVSDLNRRIAEWLRAPSGPRVPLRPVDVDAVVAAWADARPAPAPPATPPARGVRWPSGWGRRSGRRGARPS